MKNILVPVDFSDNSKNALDYAILLAKKFEMKLILLHAFHPKLVEAIKDSYKIVNREDIIGTPKDMEELLQSWQKAIKAAENDLDSDFIFSEGDLSDEINDIIEDNNIDFIVMGTKGATGLKSVLIGSNTARVIETVSCPVLAIPPDYKFKEFETIAFATDYHDNDINSITFLVNLAKKFKSKLEIVHVANEDIKPRFEEDLLEHFISKIKKSISYKKMSFHLIEGEDKINKALSEFVKQNKVDLLAISTVDRILRGPFFNRGITKGLTHHIQVPLLAFHASDDSDIDLF